MDLEMAQTRELGISFSVYAMDYKLVYIYCEMELLLICHLKMDQSDQS